MEQIRILLADDHNILRDGMRLLLETAARVRRGGRSGGWQGNVAAGSGPTPRRGGDGHRHAQHERH